MPLSAAKVGVLPSTVLFASLIVKLCANRPWLLTTKRHRPGGHRGLIEIERPFAQRRLHFDGIRALSPLAGAATVGAASALVGSSGGMVPMSMPMSALGVAGRHPWRRRLWRGAPAATVAVGATVAGGGALPAGSLAVPQAARLTSSVAASVTINAPRRRARNG